uniref:MOSC domain-containing protein n=1 Tax=Parastrongyloides trichosuri TaxID=131310 RepID=A0A0N4ZP23_PARTI
MILLYGIKIFTVSTLLIGSVCFLKNFINNYEKKEEAKEVGTVDSIFIYPVKSMRGIKVPYAECTKSGLKYGELEDRSFMVVNESVGKYVTAKDFKKMLTIQPSLENGILSLHSFFNGKCVDVKLEDIHNKRNIVKAICYEGDICEGYDCGERVSEFLKNALGSQDNLRLVKYSSSLFNQRKANSHSYETLNIPLIKKHDVKYQDEGPYMVMTTSSLNDFNNRLDNEKMSIDVFRPSILIDCDNPYDEDYWNIVKINTVNFCHSKPCTRCIITTIDQRNGSLNKSMEPLKTLRKYRLAPGKLRKIFKESPVMGVVLGIINGGIIHKQDKVKVIYKNIPC